LPISKAPFSIENQPFYTKEASLSTFPINSRLYKLRFNFSLVGVREKLNFIIHRMNLDSMVTHWADAVTATLESEHNQEVEKLLNELNS
jgi:hypothetical protein